MKKLIVITILLALLFAFVNSMHADAPIGFSSTPLQPMPAPLKDFGVKVDYQGGGFNTGIKVVGPRVRGQEPGVYAVDDGVVTHVGSLYCALENACRGKAIVIHHGGWVFSTYSHLSSTDVSRWQRVAAGEKIGRQGNTGYAFGSHLHFEVHTGAPFNSWRTPWRGGSFEDPSDWLP